ncbi:Oxoglutarate iron-dependent oxygenase [Fusarium tjaetaba]|uniref:Oxoglutarate iron-dependent oxygenase n=1 Tax=Fusarium tjaetaba TaxID=1567544 RepID=A0A8H5QJX0_9HYPO|nr:Oxoglutarate iron-dependent oxygenase [Fusarium tjaetaba]KAF5615593.1 Oxoglutarate iron-dependent oxygenase [Fusarium tjaetaba]
MPSTKTPPVIDFSDYLSGDQKRMEHCAAQIREACLTQGFFQIVNHGIPLSLQKEMFKVSKEFFDLPLEEKMKLDKSLNSYNRGYEVMHGQMIEANTKPDLKEGYYVSRDLPLDHPQVKAEKFAHGPNVWPEALGEPFRRTCMDYLHRIVQLTEEVMGAMAMSLGYDKNYFDEFCTDPMCFYKLLHYPPQPDDAHALQRGIGAHRDFGVITLLLQGDVPGLEVWDDEAKDWYPAPPVEGAYVVNMGNLFEQWTNDTYVSNVHRVINRSGEERFSIPFNYNGNPDFVIRCIESCRKNSEEEKYAPISVEDYVVQKYKDVYARAGVYKKETFAPSTKHVIAA